MGRKPKVNAMNATTRKSQVLKRADPIDATFAATKDAVERMVGPAAEKAYAYAREQLNAAAKAGEQAVSFGRGNFDTAVDVGGAMIAGTQEISRLWLALFQGAVDDGINAARRLASCRNTRDFITVQGEIARASYEKFTNDGRKLSDLSAKLVGDVSAPIAVRVESLADTFAKSTAA
jgi:phasin family protein